MTLLGADLTGIQRARRLSRVVVRGIRQNTFSASLQNAAGVPVAAGALYLAPVIVAAAMAMSSVSVVGDALKLQTTHLR